MIIANQNKFAAYYLSPYNPCANVIKNNIKSIMKKFLIALLFVTPWTFAASFSIKVPIFGYDDPKLHGSITITQVEHGLMIQTDVFGLTPGPHGYHIHDSPNCSSPDGSSAKGHYNPHEQTHGSPHHVNKHVGDMGNLDADAYGHAKATLYLNHVNLSHAPKLGSRSVIIHQDQDDLRSQPAGNSGPRIACAVIPEIIIHDKD